MHVLWIALRPAPLICLPVKSSSSGKVKEKHYLQPPFCLGDGIITSP